MLKTRREGATRDCCDARLCNALRAKGGQRQLWAPLPRLSRGRFELASDCAPAPRRPRARRRVAAMLARSVCRLLVYAPPAPRCRCAHAPDAHSCCDAGSLLFGYVYPSYACFKALERRKPDGIRAWCEYWCAPGGAAPFRRRQKPSLRRGAASCSALTRAPRAPGSCWACSRCWRAWATKPSSGACPLPSQAPRRAATAAPLPRLAAARALTRPAPQAADVLGDEGGVRHLAVAPAHAGAPAPRAIRPPRLDACVRAAHTRRSLPPRPRARRARRTCTPRSWRRCCSGTRRRWTAGWRRRRRAWATSRTPPTRAPPPTRTRASCSSWPACRSSRRRAATALRSSAQATG